MSYLERWWRDAPDAKKEALVRLLQNGQLEIVGGGWVMNDEANSHYFAIIEQATCCGPRYWFVNLGLLACFYECYRQ
ncbi:putative mannosyl-oligosaccharide 1,3-1,6-alpha-mannosidase [Helianthus debilis subsp. tardiflorus]